MKSFDLKTWIALWSCLAAAGCATQQGTAAAQCGAGGAVLGYAACKLLGGSDKQCILVGAGVGVGGAAICYDYAGKLERRHKALVGKENDLKAQIAYMQGVNEDTAALNAELSKRVADITRSTDALVARIRQQKVTQAELEKERKARDSEVASAQVQVGKADEALKRSQAYRTTLKKPDATLDAAIARQQALYDEAQRQVTALASQRSRI